MSLTKDEVLALAKEHELVEYLDIEGTKKSSSWIFGEDELLTIANAIADLQREKDAKICESLCANYFPHARVDYDKCADAIRENKE